MNKLLAVMATPGRTGCFHQPGDSASKETDPVVQGRADIKAANKTKDAEISTQKQERDQAKFLAAKAKGQDDN